MADEEGDRYLSPLDVAQHSTFSRAVHHIVDTLCQQIGLRPPAPMPKSSLRQRTRGEKMTMVPTTTSVISGVEVRA